MSNNWSMLIWKNIYDTDPTVRPMRVMMLWCFNLEHISASLNKAFVLSMLPITFCTASISETISKATFLFLSLCGYKIFQSSVVKVCTQAYSHGIICLWSCFHQWIIQYYLFLIHQLHNSNITACMIFYPIGLSFLLSLQVTKSLCLLYFLFLG